MPGDRCDLKPDVGKAWICAATSCFCFGESWLIKSPNRYLSGPSSMVCRQSTGVLLHYRYDSILTYYKISIPFQQHAYVYQIGEGEGLSVKDLGRGLDYFQEDTLLD